MTTTLDNDFIRDFLRAKYNCLFFQSFSPTKDGLYVNSFNDTFRPDSSINVQFKSFDWEPVITQTSTKEKLYYVENTSVAPIIEFSKTNWETKKNGRLYWGKFFSGSPDYDVNAFESIYNEIIKWVKSNAGGHIKSTGNNIYYFPDAWLRQVQKN